MSSNNKETPMTCGEWTWRPLGESLPEEGQLVALLSRGRDADEYSEGWPDWYDVARWGKRHFLTFSHWHPLPPLPPSAPVRLARGIVDVQDADRCEVCPAPPVGRALDDVPLCADHAPPDPLTAIGGGEVEP